jgi:hypothetical protein
MLMNAVLGSEGLGITHAACVRAVPICWHCCSSTAPTSHRKTRRGTNLLHFACTTGKESGSGEAVASAWCRRGEASGDSATPLHLACEKGSLCTSSHGNEDVVRLPLETRFLERRANANGMRKDEQGMTPLHISCLGDVDLVRLMLEHGGDVMVQDRTLNPPSTSHAAMFT